MRRVLLAGANGQVGWEFQRIAPADCSVVACGRSELDITNRDQAIKVVSELAPEWIVNAAAFTAVDEAESQVDAAFNVNANGAENLALAAREAGARLLHISTDFIFDGYNSRPHKPDEIANPQSEYGKSKLEGERRVLAILDDALIIRTGWVYSLHGHNFVKTMIRAMNERDKVSVVEDQVGTPTWGAELVKVMCLAMERELDGTYHWSDAGVASWYDFAIAIYGYATDLGLITSDVEITPIPTEAYPAPAKRPAYSVLCKESLRSAVSYQGQHWRTSLQKMIQELHHG